MAGGVVCRVRRELSARRDPGRAQRRPSPGPAEELDAWLAQAELSLQAGETQIAESHYRSVVGEGFLLLGSLEASAGRLEAARDAFRSATLATADARQATQHLAMALLELGDAKEAVTLMTHLATRNARDMGIRRLLAQALILAGRPGEALQELEDAHAAAPDDLETLYVLAAGQLRMKKLAQAQELFAELARRRPLAATHVLIGRTYRDYGEYALARGELRKALVLDPRARRAHYYLGMVAAIEDLASLDVAIAEFQQELRIAPDDPAANLSLGLALVMARRYAEALPPLQKAVLWQPPQPSAFHFLGRCLVSLERPAEAKAALTRALELAKRSGREDSQLRNIHYQLGLALRALGDAEAAAAHFAEAERLTARLADDARESLDRYLRDAAEPVPPLGVPMLDTSAFASLSAEARASLRARAATAITRACFNLGVLQTQAGRFAQAAAEFEKAAALEPDFPQLQYSLGVSWFNAQQPSKAAAPLARALEATPADQNLRRMLALASLEADDPTRRPSCSRATPGATPTLAPVRLRARARAQRPRGRGRAGVPAPAGAARRHRRAARARGPGARAAGRLPGRDRSRSSARSRSSRTWPRRTARSVSSTWSRAGSTKPSRRSRASSSCGPTTPPRSSGWRRCSSSRASSTRRSSSCAQVLRVRPDYAQARYLFGKILLAQGAAEQAAEQLEAAARIAPKDANIHYQLGRAYQSLGREDAARKEFEVFQQLKDQRPGPS